MSSLYLCLHWLVVGLFVGVVTAQYEVRDCPVEDTTFELVTGWMYSAPDDILETRAGTLKISLCLDACKKNASCLAVNYETGLCVLFGSQVGEKTDTLVKSQFPVFTMYAQKQCLPSARSCKRAWGFELVRGHQIRNGNKTQMQLPSRVACMDACIQQREFPCRSASWNNENMECSMSDLDRYNLPQSSRFIPQENVDYMESQCISEPNKMCEFKKIKNRLLKTVDALHEGVDSMEECRELCLNATFRCHTFDYEGVCRLSHHSSVTLGQVEEPYLTMNDSISWERGSCYNVTLDCRANHLVAILTTNQIFNGKVYARHRPNSCMMDVHDSMTFEMTMGYTDPACGVRQEEPGRFAADIVLQHHDQIMTSGDMEFALQCSFLLENRTIAHGIELQVSGQIQSMASESAVVPSPDVSMRITDRSGADINTAQVGDPLSLRFEIADIESPYEIFVRELIAMDGSDGAEIVLIDSRGCPTDASIMGPVTQVYSHGKVLQAFFEAFKFPTSEVVQFQAVVTPCLPTCQPVVCSLAADPSAGGTFQAMSYGRRRRSVSYQTGNETQEAPENVLVANSIRIADRFKFDENKDDLEEEGVIENFVLTRTSSSGPCLNIVGFLYCCIFFLIIQVAIIFAWFYIWRRKRSMSKDHSGAATASSPQYFYTADHRQPSVHQQFPRQFFHQVTSDMPTIPRLS